MLQFLYMLPILLSLGPVKIYSYGVVLSIGLFLALYWWWKMGRDEHWDEIALFDSFFLSLVIFLVAGRLGYVFSHFAEMGTLYRSLALLAFPGITAWVGIVASGIFLVLFARARGWDAWKAMDSAVVTLSLILVFGGVGEILNGKTLFASGWVVVWSLITFGVVSSVRKNFRFYSWYKAEASVVREGLATLIFGEMAGIYYLVAPWLLGSGQKLWGLPAMFFVGLALLVMSSYLIYRRVGRKTSLWREHLQETRLRLLQWVRQRRRE